MKHLSVIIDREAAVVFVLQSTRHAVCRLVYVNSAIEYSKYTEAMCNNDADRTSHLVAYSDMKDSPLSPAYGTLHAAINPSTIAESYRLQLYDYAQAANRLRFAQHALVPSPYGLSPYHDGQSIVSYGLSPFVRLDPRAQMIQEEPKPQHSYIGLIAMAILSSTEQKMVLSDIYQYILDHYPYFRNRGPGWRNSIRHNLSLNDCFIKAGRSANGKGHYWAIHPANIEDFKKGDFRRRKAQRKVRKHMGLAVPDDDDSPNPTPPPEVPNECNRPYFAQDRPIDSAKQAPRKRQFDMESLLAPDPVRSKEPSPCPSDPNQDSVTETEHPSTEESRKRFANTDKSVKLYSFLESNNANQARRGTIQWTRLPLCTVPMPSPCWSGGSGSSLLGFAVPSGSNRLPGQYDSRILSQRWQETLGQLVVTSDNAQKYMST